MEKRNRNIFDFMCEHPFITMMMFSSVCEAIAAIAKPRKVEPDHGRYAWGESEDMKSCGSTEEEEATE